MSIRNACRYPRSSWNVSRTRANPARTGFSAPVSSGASVRGGSGTHRKSGIENSAHQTATLMNDSLIAATVPGMPNASGIMIQSRLKMSTIPPPR